MQIDNYNEDDELLDDDDDDNTGFNTGVNTGVDTEDNTEEGAQAGAKEKYIHHQHTADKGQTPLRVDKFLMDRIEGVSRSRIQHAAEVDCLLVNGKPVKSNYKVRPLDVVALVMDKPRLHVVITPEDIPLNIVYEDADLMIVNKQPGLVVHPGHGNYTGTLLNAIAFHLKDMPGFDANNPDLGLAHRIDKDTSGLLLIAKNAEAKTFLANQFLNKTIKRQYVALVWGAVAEKEGRVEGNIGRDPKNRLLMRVFPLGDEGKTAVTHYQVAEQLGYVTLVHCRLETGRTHQIRVHMKHIGHTIYNDERYGGNDVLRGQNTSNYKQFIKNSFAECPRQCLHAKSLGFIHPTTKEELFFDSDLPADMTKVVERWRSFVKNNEI